ncbi:MAG: protease modulator HflC [Methyloceanibacter sp.]|nr:protease modulator HflC [Methyloceanibacter sp.]
MSRTFLTLVLILLGFAGIAAYLALFTVSQTEQAIVLEFGNPKRVLAEPGLHYKIPFVQNVAYFDKRILDIETGPQEVIAADKKRLVVDAFARYRIRDPLRFYQSLRNEIGAQSQIGALLDSSLRRVLGTASFEAVVRDRREELMRTILSQVNQEAKDTFGVEIVDVRIKRVDLPKANMQAIFLRMQTERQREAAEFRAEGEGASRRIRATADREVTVIKANATGESEQIRGNGDAERNRIYAEAYNKDADFFGFYRSMQAYENALKAGDTRLLLSPDSQFFEYFNNAMGRGGGKGSGGGAQPQSAPGASPQSDPLPEGKQHSGIPLPTQGSASAGSTGAVMPLPQPQ